MPEVRSSSSRPLSPYAVVYSFVVGICCRKEDDFMQYQTTRDVVSTRPPSPVLWDERKHGISGRDCTVSERYKDEWLDFGMAKFPFEMGQYLQSIGFKGLYSSIVEGKEFPFPF